MDQKEAITKILSDLMDRKTYSVYEARKLIVSAWPNLTEKEVNSYVSLLTGQ